jgi:hypothetical protein
MNRTISQHTLTWTGLLIVTAILLAAWILLEPGNAQQRISPQTLPNPTAQRAELAQELAEIKLLLREQNELLQSGRVKVTVVEGAGR